MTATAKFGSEQQRLQWLPGMAAGDVIGCFGLTGPTAGSDPASLATTAVPDADGWWVPGLKGPFSCLNEAHYWIMWGAMGAARVAYEVVLRNVLERRQFGGPLAAFQLTQQKLVDMVLEIQNGVLVATQIGRLRGALIVAVGTTSSTRRASSASSWGEDADARHHWTMQSRLVVSDAPLRMYVVVFDTGDEVVGGLKSFADDHAIGAASLTAIGACQEATVAFFDVTEKRYASIPVREQVEVLALTGNVIRSPKSGSHVHAHVVLGRRDGSAGGGHLQHAIVRPTVEVVLTELPADLRRTFDANTGLASIDLRT